MHNCHSPGTVIKAPNNYGFAVSVPNLPWDHFSGSVQYILSTSMRYIYIKLQKIFSSVYACVHSCSVMQKYALTLQNMALCKTALRQVRYYMLL